MAGYSRQDTADNIANGKVIDATDLDGEFNALESAFQSTSGHSHNGESGGGAPITVVGPAQDVIVTSSSVRPQTPDTVDLGLDSFRFKDLNLSGDANVAGTINGDLVGNVTGDLTGNVTGDLTGNATTATTWETPRNITLTGDVTGNALAVDGSLDISIATVVGDDSHNHTSGFITDFTEATQDVVGGMITGNSESGVVVTYDDVLGKLNFDVNDPTITLSGDVVGSATMTNLGSVTINTAIQPNSVALGVDTTGDYVSSLVAGTGVTLTDNTGEGATPTVGIGQPVGTTDDVSFNSASISDTLTVGGENIRDALQALASNSAGATEPSTTYAYQWWYDETTDILKMRNADNDAWISFATFDQATDTFTITTDNIDGLTATATELNKLDGVTNDAASYFTASGALSNRNLIINGAMQVAQRGTSFTNATTSWVYSLDRWKFYSETGVSATVDKVSITKDGVSVDALHWQQPSTTGNTYLGQVIEGTYLRGKTVTVSFWVDTVSNVNVLVADSVNFPTPQAVTTGRNTYTVTLASNFNADTVTLYFQSPAGASELKITDVQLEVGDTATPFEHRSYGQELALCQRYYETGDVLHRISVGNGESDHDVQMTVTKRVPPSFAFFNQIGVTNHSVSFTSVSAAGVNGSANAYTNFKYNWTADAEL